LQPYTQKSLKWDVQTKKRSPGKGCVGIFPVYKDKELPLVKSAKWKLELHQAEDDDDCASDPGCVKFAKKSVLKGLNEAIQQYNQVKKDKTKLVDLVSNIDAESRFNAAFIVDE
jgi:hypothetical protein